MHESKQKEKKKGLKYFYFRFRWYHPNDIDMIQHIYNDDHHRGISTL